MDFKLGFVVLGFLGGVWLQVSISIAIVGETVAVCFWVRERPWGGVLLLKLGGPRSGVKDV